jgi:hypothetical protein
MDSVIDLGSSSTIGVSVAGAPAPGVAVPGVVVVVAGTGLGGLDTLSGA